MKKISLLFMCSLLLISIFYSEKLFSNQKHKVVPQKQKPEVKTQTETNENIISLNNSWYVMQSGSTPWGYFHEAIEQKGDKYIYRYEMLKNENNVEYLENMGAIAMADLTPVAFNLSKAGANGTEIVNGTYSKTPNGGLFKLDIQGAKAGTLKRNVSKDTILEVFFPIYLSQNWSKLKPNYTNSIRVFTEDPSNGAFTSRAAKYTVKAQDTADNCLWIDVMLDETKSNWCLTEKGSLIKMNINNNQIQVKKVANENEAKAFIKREK